MAIRYWENDRYKMYNGFFVGQIDATIIERNIADK